MDNIGYVLTDGKVFLSSDNMLTSEVKHAIVYCDKNNAEFGLKTEILFAEKRGFTLNLKRLKGFYTQPVIIEKLEESKLIESIENLLGILDSPIGRRKFKSEFSKEAIKTARNLLEKYKV